MGEISNSNILNNMSRRDNQKRDKIKGYRIGIYKLEKEQKRENDYDKKMEKTQELKKHLEEILKIVPNDREMKIKLMYADIKLKQIDEARKLGTELLEASEQGEVLNGMAIIEEIEGNYDIAIEYLNKIIEIEPNNEFWKKKIERINRKKEKTKAREILQKEKIYRKIATLERSVRNITEKQLQESLVQGKETDKTKIVEETYIRVYSKVKELAEKILLYIPEEIVAREKLVKALFIMGNKEEAMQEAEELLRIHENDEIALWYMAKIQRGQENLEGEKEYLEKMIENSKTGTQIKAQQRLEKIKKILEKKEKQKELENLAQENYTEETRREFIDKVQNEFYCGTITIDDIEKRISEAHKYPNFNSSIIELLDIKSKMNGDFEQKIEDLEKYLNEEYSTMTPTEYNNVLDEIANTRKKIEEEKRIEKYVEKKEQEMSKLDYDDNEER